MTDTNPNREILDSLPVGPYFDGYTPATPILSNGEPEPITYHADPEPITYHADPVEAVLEYRIDRSAIVVGILSAVVGIEAAVILGFVGYLLGTLA